MFFQLKEKPVKSHETYDKIFELVKAVLHFECPDHRANHHILYTANTKLENYREARDFYRPFDDPSSELGLLSREAYQLATKKYNQLYTIIRGYMHLCEENKREHFNHHFRFHVQKIEAMYKLYENKSAQQLLQIEELFFERLKADLTPLLTQFE
ncbi:hypothetical protein DCE79_05090 [Lysinibacillus sp. 2017]|uniref:hypothetical protein n=1 Tax=unclassified Lysinibacillus TaxID=2636778 RepID=UPI000D527026|nr:MULTISPECIES: hypothetical protein [unclassified Lysinibacillus]AWE06809.1 hypothetical protein DCE79_05090 [Lysinibacillus sp. 2017]TGN37260.1 hypothetical protein E4L99_01905 [Lysinibacillus sp. S2017]